MDDKVRKITEAVRAERGWKANEIRVDEVEELRRPACSFYTVGYTARMSNYLVNYALVGEKVVGLGDGSVVAKILDTCSNGAGADWWAEIVTRFHRDLGFGLVLADETVRRDVVRKMREAGKAFTPPALDKAKQSLTFLLMNPETNVLYSVHATRTAGGPVEVVKTKVMPLAA